VRGTLRIAPATEPARPALHETVIQNSAIQGFKDPGFEDQRFAIRDW